MKKIAFTTLGCKANWVDTEEMIAVLRGNGFEIVSFESFADAYVVNTCTVTSIADGQSRQMLRRARRANPNAIVIATGCSGEVGGKDLSGICDAVFGTKDRSEVLKFIFKHFAPLDSRLRGNDKLYSTIIEEQSRARAFLKIEDGCNRHCAYCIVPRARGEVRSMAPKEVVGRALALAKYHREIVLTGIDISQYGTDLGENITLAGLLADLIKMDELPRIRVSSVEPNFVDDRFIDLFARSKKICRHVHLSIQSLSEKVLKSMNREYDPAKVCKIIKKLVKEVPDIAVTGDIIAGFVGETDEDHEETLNLIKELPLAGLHIFPYSEREGTKAYEMSGKVPPEIRKRRARELRELASGLKKNFLENLLGKSLDAIVISKEDKEGLVEAFSDNAVSILAPAHRVSYGEIGRLKISQVSNLTVKGLWE